MISVVANFYKSEAYISKLVRSLIEQSYTDWELICVNDCSPGRDSEILHSYADSDSRIRVIDNPVNMGISRSKKVGIDAARGEYITFIDGDDFFAKDALLRLYQAARDYDVDVVAMHTCRYIPVLGRKFVSSHGVPSGFYDRRVENPELFDECFVNFFGCFKFSVTYWGKLYRTCIVKELDFDYPDSRHTAGEDYKFSLCLFQHIQSMAFISYMGYYWRWGGITSGNSVNDWAPYRFMMTHLDFYLERKDILAEYDYRKGYRPLLVELKNIIICGVCNMLDAGASASDARDKVATIFGHPAADDIPQLLQVDAYRDNKLVRAMAIKDVPGFVDLCRSQNSKTRTRRMIRRALLKILSLINR